MSASFDIPGQCTSTTTIGVEDTNSKNNNNYDGTGGIYIYYII
jgi:hypothetical protein